MKAHVHEELHEFVSGRVNAAERQQIEEHLATCEECRAERDRLSGLRELLRHFGESEDVPPDLLDRVRVVLDRGATPRRSAWLIGLAAAIVIVIAALLLQRARKDIPSAAADEYQSIRSGETSLELRTRDVAEMERWLDARLPFPTRVFDFAMMRYELVGGSIGHVANRSSALFAYRKESGEWVVCQMYEGRVEDLPSAIESREHNGIRFFVYEQKAITTVFWQEGTVVCVLTSEIPREEAVSLAFAKAMKAPTA